MRGDLSYPACNVPYSTGPHLCRDAARTRGRRHSKILTSRANKLDQLDDNAQKNKQGALVAVSVNFFYMFLVGM